MSQKSQMNVQDMFLNQARKDCIPVSIQLLSGTLLKGVIRGFDFYTILLQTQGKPTTLVYKHAVATIVPCQEMMLFRNAMTAMEEQPIEAGVKSDCE